MAYFFRSCFSSAAETTIATNIQPGITFGAWELAAVELNLSPNLVKAWASADSDLTFQVTKRSIAGAVVRLVTYTDTDLIASYNLAMILQGTAANWTITPTSFLIQMPPGVLIYSENLYLQLISTGTGATNIAWGRIFYELMNLTAAQAMAVIASRP